VTTIINDTLNDIANEYEACNGWRKRYNYVVGSLCLYCDGDLTTTVDINTFIPKVYLVSIADD
jgi:hypothetical protein